jgi:hypothetical protein
MWRPYLNVQLGQRAWPRSQPSRVGRLASKTTNRFLTFPSILQPHCLGSNVPGSADAECFSLTKPCAAVQSGAVLTTGRVKGKQDFRQYMVSPTAFPLFYCFCSIPGSGFISIRAGAIKISSCYWTGRSLKVIWLVGARVLRP